MRVRPMQPDDALGIAIQPAQSRDWPEGEALASHMARIRAAGSAFTVRADDGEPLLCAGLIRNHGDWASAWALVSAHAGPAMVTLTRMIARHFNGSGYRRIDTMVRADFEAGIRWARALGFRQEGIMAQCGADGCDLLLMARLAGGDRQ